MAILSRYNDVFTVMVEFDTTAEHQDEVIAAIRELAGVFPSQPGFVSEHFHRSDDGERVVVYLQWRTEQNHLDCYNNRELQPLGAPIMQLVQSGKATMNVRTYRVAESREAPSAGAGGDDQNREASTKELVLRYFNSWQHQDWETMRSCLADTLDFEGPDGQARAMPADEFTAFCSKGSPWREVELIDSMFADGHASLLYQGVDTKNDSKVRVGEFVTVEGGKIARLRAAFAFGAQQPPL